MPYANDEGHPVPEWWEKAISAEEKEEIHKYLQERDEVLGRMTIDGPALVEAATLKEELAGVKSPIREKMEEAWHRFNRFESGLPDRPLTEEEWDKRQKAMMDLGLEERRVHRAKCLEKARELRALQQEFVHAVLTQEEHDHCVRYNNDKEFRRTGDSHMARAHRLKDEVMAAYPVGKIRELTKDLPLMKLYMRLRKGFKKFQLSADSQQAYDEVAGALAEMPKAVAAAMGQSP